MLLKTEIDIDITRMSQVLRNLISNALKFTPKRSAVSIVIGKIRGVTSTSQSILRIQVIDSGAGITQVQ